MVKLTQECYFDGRNTSDICNDEFCDTVANEYLGRCKDATKCPSGFGIYKDDDGESCYKDVCPTDSTEEFISDIESICWQLQCPEGFTEDANGICVE